MSTPDAAAAAEPQHVPLHELTHEHVGAVITYQGVTGHLKDTPVESKLASGDLVIAVLEPGRPFLTTLGGPGGDLVEIVHAAPPSPYDDEANAADETPRHIVLARELAQISDSITAHKGEIDGLEARKAEIDAELMKYFEMAGDTQLSVDGRKVYLKPRTFPVYRERPAGDGGGKYTADDVVAALREIGRAADIKPPSVNHQTLGAILREYRDAEKPVPPALDAVVKLDEEIKIAVGAPRRGRR
jgi:hypothetical protein